MAAMTALRTCLARLLPGPALAAGSPMALLATGTGSAALSSQHLPLQQQQPLPHHQAHQPTTEQLGCPPAVMLVTRLWRPNAWLPSPPAQCSRRSVYTCAAALHDAPPPAAGGGDSIMVTFVEKDGTEHTVQAPLGKNLLEVAHDHEIDLEGACEGSLACSTCHVVVENEEYFQRMPEPSEDELDMLDLAFGLTETSRLGCQVIAAKELDGLRVRIPAASRNFYVDGHKPKPH